MSSRYVCLAVLLSLVLMFAASAGGHPEIVLWPNGMPAPVIAPDPPERVEKDGIQRRFNISKPRLVVYRAIGAKVSKAGIIVVPGGGFGRLADEHEGSEACEWLAKNGVTSFLLLHRTPTDKHPEPSAGPVQDLQKGVMEIHKRAGEYGLDPKQIGVLGFSAGGQVTLIAATNDPKFEREAGSASHRPDFLLAIYPYKIYDPGTKALRSDIHPEAGLPPTFIAQMGDDTASLAQGSTLLYLELLNRKVPAELHVYEKGGHGFGMRARPGATGPTDWPARALDWLRLRGYAPTS
jgi:acetyl esterase/lipase